MQIPSNSTNISNLRYLYCEAPNEPVVEKLDDTAINERLHKKFSTYFYTLTSLISDRLNCDRLIDKGYLQAPRSTKENLFKLFVSVAGAAVPGGNIIAELAHEHIPHLVESIIELGIEAMHLGHELHHSVHEGHYKEIASDLQGIQMDAFINNITEELCLRFRHEIFMLEDEQCKELANKHFAQVISCLELQAESNRTPTQKILFNLIIEALDPHPKLEIDKRINEYITNRAERWFFCKSQSQAREIFLNSFKAKLSESDIEVLISELGECTIFCNDWSFWEEEKNGKSITAEKPLLGLQNPLVSHLSIYRDFQQPVLGQINGPFQNFNNPFMTAWFWNHISMKSISEDVLVLLMRFRTLEVLNCRDEANQKVFNVSKKIIEELPWLIIKPLIERIEYLVKEVLEIKKKTEALEEKLEIQNAEISDQKVEIRKLKKRVVKQENVNTKLQQSIEIIKAQHKNDVELNNFTNKKMVEKLQEGQAELLATARLEYLNKLEEFKVEMQKEMSKIKEEFKEKKSSFSSPRPSPTPSPRSSPATSFNYEKV